MNTIKNLITATLVLLAFSSCKSFNSLAVKDNSTAKSSSKKRSGDVKFLKDIEVRPGNTASATKHSSASKKYGSLNTEGKGLKTPVGFNIETADWLQFKYAILTDVTVEKLLNVPLLKVIDYWYGTKYCIGGSTVNCVDCSAFTQSVLREAFQTDIPRTAQDQYNTVNKIDVSELREGDLVFFNTGGRAISHVGVYLLNNKFVHAATSGGVMVSDLNETYWRARFRGAGRAIGGMAGVR